MADDSLGSDTDTIILIDYDFEIHLVLPDIRESKLNSLKACLIELGITASSDLAMVRESDLNMMTAIEARKLVNAWQRLNKGM